MKLKVFVSSTIKDLQPERTAAVRGILDTPAIPIMSDKTFNAMDKSPLDACLSKVRESNIYVLILGGKYGFEYKGKSITEWEYETANILKLPKLVFNLSYYEKDEKQEQFKKRIGDLTEGRFWVEPKDAFELQELITNSLRELIKELDTERFQRKELLYPNLIAITFPKKLFIAEKIIDRDDIIEKSWQTNFKLRKRCTDRQLVVRAVLFNSDYCPEGWYSFENKIISFRDISNKDEPLNSIVDVSTVEEIETSHFYTISDDYKNHFKALIKKTIIEFLRSRKIYRVKEKNKDIYRFGMLDLDNPSIRKIKWKKTSESKRKVIHERISKEDGHIICFRHLAFKFTIEEINNKWFICLNPTWSFTSNGIKRSNFQRQYLSGIKEQENSQAVFNHFAFLHYFFTTQTYLILNQISSSLAINSQLNLHQQ